VHADAKEIQGLFKVNAGLISRIGLTLTLASYP